MDQIVVLKEGVVIDNGTYDELVGKNEELNIMMEKWVKYEKTFQNSRDCLKSFFVPFSAISGHFLQHILIYAIIYTIIYTKARVQ